MDVRGFLEEAHTETKKVLNRAQNLAGGQRVSTALILVAATSSDQGASSGSTLEFLARHLGDFMESEGIGPSGNLTMPESAPDVTEHAASALQLSTQLSQRATSDSKVTFRCLLGALLVQEAKETGAKTLIEKHAGSLDELKTSFLEFLRESHPEDNISAWETILG